MLKKALGKASTFATLMYVNLDVYAQTKKGSLGDNDVKSSNLIENLLGELAWWKILVIALAGFSGLWITITGINSLIKSKDPALRQDHKADVAAFKIIGGVALISVAFAIMVIGNTFFGTGEQIENHYYSEEYR